MPPSTDKQPRFHRYPAHVRQSPYLEFAIAEGAVAAWPYNRMWLPTSYGRDPRVEYQALLEGVTLWDVGCERALELTGPDAVPLADYLLTRDVAGQPVGRCRHATACDESGVILCEALVLRLDDERVWICHGPADLPLWARAIAQHTDHDVEVHEAPVSPLALQGPRALDVMQALAPAVASMPRFAWAWASIADVDVLISRTGFSGEFGYEVFAPDVEPARRVWQEVRRAADPFGVLVTPVNDDRAWERGLTDIRYGDNLGINPFEVGLGHAVDLDKSARFIGDEALRQISDGSRPRRHAVSFTIDGDAVPDQEAFWPIAGLDGEHLGVVWNVGYSYALDKHAGDALLDQPLEIGARLVLQSPSGPLIGTVVPRPLVAESATERPPT
jgi:glycine cleavage system aminomethyltransferase T